jgi:hypothetical protein
MQFIALPGLLRAAQITTTDHEERIILSIAKDYCGYKGKRVVVTGAAYQPQLAPNKFQTEVEQEVYKHGKTIVETGKRQRGQTRITCCARQGLLVGYDMCSSLRRKQEKQGGS